MQKLHSELHSAAEITAGLPFCRFNTVNAILTDLVKANKN